MRHLHFFIAAILLYSPIKSNSQIKIIPKIQISYTNLSERYKSILSKHENSLIKYCIACIDTFKRKDILFIKVRFSSENGIPYAFFEIPYSNKVDTLRYYDKETGLVLLDVTLPVHLEWSARGVLFQDICNDNTVSFQEKNVLQKLESIIRICKTNGDYFEMYVDQEGIWYRNIRVYTKKNGIHSIDHASNVEMVHYYSSLLFQKPIDDLTGKLTHRALVYDFFGFTQWRKDLHY